MQEVWGAGQNFRSTTGAARPRGIKTLNTYYNDTDSISGSIDRGDNSPASSQLVGATCAVGRYMMLR